MTFFLFSCHRKTTPIKSSTTTVITEASDDEVMKIDTMEIVEENILPDTLFLVKKSACFGQCPVFESMIKSDGKAYYNGKMNVSKIGMYSADVPKAVIDNLKDISGKIKFFEKADHYPESGEDIVDLPLTKIMAKWDGQRKRITINHMAPKELTDFERFLIKTLDGLEWNEVVQN